MDDALPSLVDISSSTVVFLERVEPRYVNLSTSSSVVSLIVKRCVTFDCDMVTVFLRLIVKTKLAT